MHLAVYFVVQFCAFYILLRLSSIMFFESQWNVDIDKNMVWRIWK